MLGLFCGDGRGIGGEHDGPSSMHVSTLASSGESSSTPDTAWNKRSPLKTYSKKSKLEATPPHSASTTPKEPSSNSEGKSRYGRTRKIRVSEDFYSTDRLVGQYLKVEAENQIDFRFTYHDKKSFTRKPGYTRNANIRRCISVGSLLPVDNVGSSTISSGLDLAAPTSPETLETPLALLEQEVGTVKTEATAPSDFVVGDLTWAAIPPHPYWPALISRDPITNSMWKSRTIGPKRTNVDFWHVHFFGDKGMRGWVSKVNMLPFTGLESYQAFQKELTANIDQLTNTQRKAIKLRQKLFVVKNSFKLVWESAVDEAENLLSSSREERLEYFTDTYQSNKINKRSRSLSCDDLTFITKKARQSLPVSAVSTVSTPKSSARKRNSEPIQISKLGISKSDSSQSTSEPIEEEDQPLDSVMPSKPWLGKKRFSLRTTPKRSSSPCSESSWSQSLPKTSPSTPTTSEIRTRSSRKSIKVEESEDNGNHNNGLASPPHLMNDQVEQKTPKSSVAKKSVENRAAQTSPIQLLPLVVKSAVVTKTPNGSSLLKGVFVTSVLQNIIGEGEIVSISSAHCSASEPPPIKRGRGRPRKYWPLNELVGSHSANAKTTQPSSNSYDCVENSSSQKVASPPSTPVSARRRNSLPLIPGITPLPTRKRGRPWKKPIFDNGSLAGDRINSSKTAALSSNSTLPLIDSSTVKEDPKTVSSPSPNKYSPRRKSWRTSTKSTEPVEKKTAAKRIKSEPISPSTSEGSQSVDALAKESTIVRNCRGATKSEPLAKNCQPRKTCLFAGIKDKKLCSICLKGKNVQRCKGPCSTYMHIECAGKSAAAYNRRNPETSPLTFSKKTAKLRGVYTYNAFRRYKTAMDKLNLEEKAENPAAVGTVLSYSEFVNDEELFRSYCPQWRELTDSIDEQKADVQEEVQSLSVASSEWGVDEVNSKDTSKAASPECMPGHESLTRIGQEFPDENDSLVDPQTADGKNLDLQLNESSSFPVSPGMPTPPPEDIPKTPEEPPCTDSIDVKEPLNVIDSLSENSLLSKPTELNSSGEKINGSSVKKDAKDKGWWCNRCLEEDLGPCFVCGKGEGERIRCKIYLCGKVYHLDCAKQWPQHSLKQSSKGKMIFNCPAHTCHTCISDNPASLTSRYLNDRLVRCVRCPTTYHYGNYCVPAGSEVLTSTQIICPRHYKEGKKSLSHLNASWCFLCSVGGSLICCDLCPHAFHVECLRISSPEGAYICEDCETGRYPLYGEVVWAKLGRYRWWPARILFPQEIPLTLLKADHVPGEFVVRFYGTYNYYWVNRGRVFLFHEGDGKKQESISLLSKVTHKDSVFNTGVLEANEDFIVWTEERNCRQESQRPSMKPPKFVKITSNKPVGSIKMNEADASSLTACDCKSDQKDPCGVESDCINRLLMVECSPQICPAGDRCNNQNFEKRNYPSLIPYRTESRGWGLKTVVPLKKGDFVIEYVGEMIDEEEYKRRLKEMQKSKDENFYFLILDKDRILDAGPKGNLARFMNHSCQPNCETQKWTVEGDTRVGLFTLKDIPADTELVFNYNLMTTGDSKLECRCSAPNCVGFIGGKPTKPLQPTSSKSKGTLATRKKTQKKNRRNNKLARAVLVKSSTNAASAKLVNGHNGNAGSSKEDEIKCFACHSENPTLTCQDSQCSKMYHLSCLGLTKDPSKRWTCPWHECSICGSRNKVENCSLCINSYCSEHQEGNIILNRGKGGSHCHNHNMSDSGSDWSTEDKEEETIENGHDSLPLANNT